MNTPAQHILILIGILIIKYTRNERCNRFTTTLFIQNG